MNKALVTLDLKKDSGNLVQKAVDWSNAFGGEIVLLHVELMDLDNKSLNVGSVSDSEDKLIKGRNLEAILAIEAQLVSNGIPFRRVVRSGNPQDVILDVAKTENVDLILMGLNRHSAAYKFLIGSVADMVVKKTETPVLLVPNS